MSSGENTDLVSSMGFTSFGKQHPPTSSSKPATLPPKPQQPPSWNSPTASDLDQNPHLGSSHHGNRGGSGGGRNWHDNRGRGRGGGRGRGRGRGRGGRHHPYQYHNQQSNQFSTGSNTEPINENYRYPQVEPYISETFGEGLYRASMIEDPWGWWRQKDTMKSLKESEQGHTADNPPEALDLAVDSKGHRNKVELEVADSISMASSAPEVNNNDEIDLDIDDDE